MTEELRPSPSTASPDLADPDQAPLYDPYLTAPRPPPRGGLSRLALSAILAPLLGPVGAILAIVFGWYARREIEREAHRLKGHALATAGMVLGVLATMAWGGILSYFAWTFRYRVDPAGDEPSAQATAPHAARAPQQSPPPARAAPVLTDPFAPKNTKVHKEGAVTVVDLGMSTASLSGELAKQRAEAAKAGETLMVMTTAARCQPCTGVDQSLLDPLLQAALAKVRLVRIDVLVFHEDLEELKIPDQAIPGFFLLSLDLTPRDGVNGGEWDDDIPPNIAPVLGAFVRGKYVRRREPWQPVPQSGVTL